MRYTLKDYQTEAVRDALRNLTQARDLFHRYGSRSQFSLAATTGAGKTVMATAIIEALFFGNDEFDHLADPGAVVLWFSDDPSLNEQSRARIQTASSELDGRLRVIENSFSESSLRPGYVYFLNMQKLNKNSRLVRRGEQDGDGADTLVDLRPDQMQQSIYDILTNTIEDAEKTLYFVLDEAHRGMNPVKDRTTIVQRLINGFGTVPPMPIVFGISATVERFDEAMQGARAGRTALPSVEVDSALVQASGLLKDDIILAIPTESGIFDTVLLTRAVEKVRASTAAWDAYAAEQGDIERVAPLLIVQLADKPTNADLLRVVDTIYDAWPDLGLHAVANVFGDYEGRSHPDLSVGQQPIPYIEPQRVQQAKHIRVLLAKTAISTGWDCPRAEVLVSFRAQQDRTAITQLLGRMVRTPLARRIPGNEILNSVDCLLPFFNRATANEVADALTRGGKGKSDDLAAGGGTGRRVLIDPLRLERSSFVDESVWAALETLPNATIPRGNVKPIRRLTGVAACLAADGLVPGAVDEAHRRLHKVLDGRAVQHDSDVTKARADVLTMAGEEVRRRLGANGGVDYASFSVSADPRAIEDSYRNAVRLLSPALCSSYVDHIARPDEDGEDDLLEAHITTASLALVPEIVAGVEQEAEALAREWLTKTRVARKGLTDERQAEYDRWEGMSTQPERTAFLTPVEWQADSRYQVGDDEPVDLPTWEHHIMVSVQGTYPALLNEWERKVLVSEMNQPGFKAWYRNPPRASKDSLAVPYKDSATGSWKPMRPDFVFFGTNHDGSVAVDLVDPHGHYLSDALPKLRGLADYAETYEAEFRRIESVAQTDGTMRVLDLTQPHVRQAIRDAADAKRLYLSDAARDY